MSRDCVPIIVLHVSAYGILCTTPTRISGHKLFKNPMILCCDRLPISGQPNYYVLAIMHVNLILLVVTG